jgi:ATP-binding cassette subfamily B protein
MTSGLVTQLVELPFEFFHNAKQGEVVERVRDLDRVQSFVSIEAMEALTASVSILSLGILLLFVNLAIFVIFFASAASYFGWIYLVGRRRRATDAAHFSESSGLRALEIGMVESIQDIRIAGHEQAALAHWAEVQIAALHTKIKAAEIEQIQATGGHFFTRVGLILVTFVSAQRAISGAITLGDFTITSVIAVQLYFHLNQILTFVNKLEEVRGAMHRIGDIRRLHESGTDRQRRTVAPSGVSPIAFDAVTFRYPGATRASLSDVSIAFPTGAMTALVGPSGSGKTTVLKLLLQLYEPASGAIQVADMPLARIRTALWHREIGAVMQDGTLFAGSLRDNVIGNQSFDRGWFDDVVAAARLADVMTACEEGLDTLLGPGGTRLSAGQVQRILIARALYKRPGLLLMDEPTSALDGANEAAVMENIARLLPGVTTVVAAHRLNTVQRAKLVVSLDGGRVVASGRTVPSDAMILSTAAP